VLNWVLLADVNLRYLYVQRLAWTMADLAGRDVPGRDELAVTLAMRRGSSPAPQTGSDLIMMSSDRGADDALLRHGRR
jgi:hypothetical protein